MPRRRWVRFMVGLVMIFDCLIEMVLGGPERKELEGKF
jgi:hypothetical protein